MGGLFWGGKKGGTSLFLLTKRPPFLIFPSTEIKDLLGRHVSQGYPGSNDKTHLFTKVITARAENLSFYVFQNYQENIFSELDF